MVEITDAEMMAAMKRMKKGKATGLDEIRVEMPDLAGDVGVNWTRRLLNSCLTVLREDSGRVADRIDHSDMEDERGCTRPGKI